MAAAAAAVGMGGAQVRDGTAIDVLTNDALRDLQEAPCQHDCKAHRPMTQLIRITVLSQADVRADTAAMRVDIDAMSQMVSSMRADLATLRGEIETLNGTMGAFLAARTGPAVAADGRTGEDGRDGRNGMDGRDAKTSVVLSVLSGIPSPTWRAVLLVLIYGSPLSPVALWLIGIGRGWWAAPWPVAQAAQQMVGG